jgi:hypothetical protein
MSSLPGPPGGRPLTATTQPALHRLVQDCAARLGVPAPQQIWLGPDTVVEGGFGRRGTGLVVGLPVAWSLSRAELTALIEHELAALAATPTRAEARRYRRWARAKDIVVPYDDGERPPRSAARAVHRLEPRAGLVERAADGACADAVVAARAFVRLARLSEDLLMFALEVQGALSSYGGLRFWVSDLHDGWRRRLDAEAAWAVRIDGEVIDLGEAEMTGKRHPLLATAARSLVGQPLDLRPAAEPVEVRPLTIQEQRELAKAFRSESRYVRWRTFATVPATMWRRDAIRQARLVLAPVARVLGREPADYAEAADVIRSRPAEVTGLPIEDQYPGTGSGGLAHPAGGPAARTGLDPGRPGHRRRPARPGRQHAGRPRSDRPGRHRPHRLPRTAPPAVRLSAG